MIIDSGRGDEQDTFIQKTVEESPPKIPGNALTSLFQSSSGSFYEFSLSLYKPSSSSSSVNQELHREYVYAAETGESRTEDDDDGKFMVERGLVKVKDAIKAKGQSINSRKQRRDEFVEKSGIKTGGDRAELIGEGGTRLLAALLLRDGLKRRGLKFVDQLIRDGDR
ncbi:unnamed protein product [Vicia faba]|uniref:Uncharacterized protein n=1 Tax=Vicia faba TaxID=3906 RepID=A0AAV0ZRL3_VICFA|nr:unnamed protein product [Vicia faba]